MNTPYGYTFKAGADLSSALYHIVRISNGADAVNIASESVHSSMIGVLLNAPAATGRHASVAYIGQGKVTAGAAINSVGVFFTCNGSGRAVAAASGDMVAGRILETAAANGDVVQCQLMLPVRLSGAI